MPPGDYRTVAVAPDVMCALDGAGRVTCLSDLAGLGIGDGTTTPTPAAGALRFRDLTLGGVTVRPFACGVTLDGDLYCWGTNGAGQLGSAGPDSSTPVQLLPGLKFVAVDQTCAVTSEGAIYCW